MRTSAILIGLITLLAGCVSADPPPRFGMQGHSMQGGGERHQRTVGLMGHAGIEIMRDECHWGFVEREPGVFQIPETWLESLSVNEEIGVETLLILNYCNDNYDDGMAPHTDEGRAAYARYCATMARETQGRVTYFEIWNEPNASGFWPPEPNPEDYAALVAVAEEAIREANPDAVIIAGSTSGIPEDFWRRAFEAGLADHCDAISIHPYCTPESPEGARIFERMEAIHEMSGEYGEPLNVWITEFGYPTRGANSVNEDRQANVIARTYLLALTKPWVDATFLYWFGPDQRDDEWNENNFGLVRHDWSLKPSFHAFETITRLLGNAEFEQSLAVGDGIQAHVFFAPTATGGTTRRTALWAQSGVRHIEIATETDLHLVLRDGDGFTMSPSSRNGAVTLDLSDAPLYILSDEVPQVTEVDEPIVTFEPTVREVTVSDYLYALAHPNEENFTSNWEMARLDAMWSVDFEIEPFEGGSGPEPDRRQFSLVVEVSENLLGRVRPFARLLAQVNVVDSARVVMTPLQWRDESPMQAQLVVQSQTTVPINGTLTLHTEGGEVIEPTALTIEGLEGMSSLTQMITFDAPSGASATHSIAGSLELDNGETIAFNEHFSFMTSPRVASPITLDGDLSDWPMWDAINIGSRDQVTGEFEAWGGLEDASARVYTAWDDTNFYLAAEVTDQTLADAVSGHEMYKNDGFEIYIDADREGDRQDQSYSDDDSQFAVGPVQGGAVVWDYKRGNQPSTASRIVVNRAPTAEQTVSGAPCNWIVEVAFPLSLINLEPRDGLLIGFNVALNDDDDPRRVHPFGQDLQMMWNGRRECWLNPRNFSNLFLVDPTRTE